MSTRAQSQRALDEYEAVLMSKRNVVGLGILRADGEDATPSADTSVVAVYVEHKLPLEQLAEEDVVPKTLHVTVRNRTLEVRTKVIEQGPVQLEGME